MEIRFYADVNYMKYIMEYFLNILHLPNISLQMILVTPIFDKYCTMNLGKHFLLIRNSININFLQIILIERRYENFALIRKISLR